MQKSLIGFLALAALVFLGTSTAKAQTAITLSVTSSGVTFASGPSDTATASFSASGTASSSSPSGSYTYTLTGGPVTLTESPPTSNYYTASNTPLTLTLTGSGSLSGTVDLIDLSQTGKSGDVNTNFIANVTVTSASGTLAEFASAGSGTLTLLLKLAVTTHIDELTSPESAGISSGSITPSPEPRTMVLFGSGLVLLGGFLRRQLRA